MYTRQGKPQQWFERYTVNRKIIALAENRTSAVQPVGGHFTEIKNTYLALTSGPRQGPVVASCEYGNEPSGPIKDEDILV
jgi:hypothetical protein